MVLSRPRPPPQGRSALRNPGPRTVRHAPFHAGPRGRDLLTRTIQAMYSVVDSGLVVNLGYYHAPNQPRSPNPPRYAAPPGAPGHPQASLLTAGLRPGRRAGSAARSR